jgi:hypothetical protein
LDTGSEKSPVDFLCSVVELAFANKKHDVACDLNILETEAEGLQI